MKRSFKKIAALSFAAALSVSSVPALAATNQSSSDGVYKTEVTGSKSSSINSAISAAKKAISSKGYESAVIEIPAGTYTFDNTISLEDVSNITLKGKGNVVIDGNGIYLKDNKNADMICIKGNNIVVENIKVTGIKLDHSDDDICPTGIRVEGNSSNITIYNCEVNDVGCKYDWNHKDEDDYNAHGIIVGTDPSDPITNVTIEKCTVTECDLGNSEALVLNGNVSNFLVKDNIVTNNDNIGIDLIGYEKSNSKNYEKDTARNGLVINNYVYNNSSDPEKNLTYDSECAAGIYSDGGSNIEICNNYIDKCDMGIEVSSEWKGRASDSINVHDNIVIDVKPDYLGGMGIGGCLDEEDDNGNYKETGIATNCHIYHNTVYVTKGSGLMVQRANDKNNVIENNIFAVYGEADTYTLEKNSKHPYDNTGNTIKNNLVTVKSSISKNDTVFNQKKNGITIESSDRTISFDAKYDKDTFGADFSRTPEKKDLLDSLSYESRCTLDEPAA